MLIRKKCSLTKTISFILLTLLIFLIFFYIFNRAIQKFTNSTTPKPYISIGRYSINLPNVVVHLDLKNYPPKFSYINRLLLRFRKLNATGLLVEYGDMFPFEDNLVNLSAKHGFNKTELQGFLKRVAYLGFDIIPLVHISHLEQYLDIKEMEHLKKSSAYSSLICSQSWILMQSILEQIIKFHQILSIPLKYLHIGFDEINYNYIYECELSLQTNKTYTNSFLNHLKAITNLIKDISPNTTILMWDDLLRDIPIDELENVKNLRIEPIYSDFRPTIKLSQSVLYKYHEKMNNIWIASAYKGIKSNKVSLPNIKERFSNNLSWMKRIQTYKFVGDQDTYSFKGIILMGKSPFELFPVSLPSLFINLLLIKQFRMSYNLTAANSVTDFFDQNLNDEIARHLVCSDNVDIDHFNIDQCFFDGNDLYEIMTRVDHISDRITKLNDQSSKLCERLLKDLWNLEDEMTETLLRYYEKHFVEEYVNLKLKASKKILYEILNLSSSDDININA